MRIAIAAAIVVWMLIPASAFGGEAQAIAVITFDNLTGSKEHDWVGVGFAEAVSDKLRNLERIRIRDRREIADIARVEKLDLRKISSGSRPGAGGGPDLARLIGCDIIVVGSIQAAGAVDTPEAPLRVNARLLLARSGEISNAVQVDGKMGELFALQGKLALALASQLDDDISQVARDAMQAHGTDSLAAYKAYCEGLRLLDEELKYDEALQHFDEACRLHPGILYADAHHAMGTAFLRAGRIKEMLARFSKDVAERAPIWYDLGVACENAGKYEQAAEAFKTFVKYTDRRFAPWEFQGTGAQSAVPDFLPCESPGEVLILCRAEGDCSGLDSRSGRLLWNQRLGIPAGQASYAGRFGYWGTAGGEVIRVNVQSGELGWKAEIDGRASTPLRLLEEKRCVAIGTSNGELAVLASESGRTNWRRNFGVPLSALEQSGAALFVGDAKGGVKCVSAGKGEDIWRADLESQVVALFAFGGCVVAVTADHRHVGLSCADGKVVWEIASVSAFARCDELADGYLALRGGDTLCLVKPDGGFRWEKKPGFKVGAMDCDSSLAVIDKGGRLAVFSMRTGEALADLPVTAGMTGFVVGGGSVFVKGESGGCAKITAYSLAASNNEPDDKAGLLHLASSLERKGDVNSAIEVCQFLLGSVDAHCCAAMQALEALYRKAGRASDADGMMRRLRGEISQGGQANN